MREINRGDVIQKSIPGANPMLPFKNLHLTDVTYAECKLVANEVFEGLLKNQSPSAAAALAYYSFLSVFPALILLSAVMAYIPLPGFFTDVLVAMAHVVPRSTMPVVYSVLVGFLGKDLRAWLSFGTLGTLWLVSSVFDEMIDALDTAYDVSIHRPIWKSRLIALGLAAIVGGLLMCDIAVLIASSKASQWLEDKVPQSGISFFLRPVLHWVIGIGFTLVTVQIVYFLAPNVKQKFSSTLPGAVLSIISWLGLSFLLGLYFRYFQYYNRVYGTLGGIMALMTWLYWAYFIFLAGGALNAELAKLRAAKTSKTAE
jgi:membrane protein